MSAIYIKINIDFKNCRVIAVIFSLHAIYFCKHSVASDFLHLEGFFDAGTVFKVHPDFLLLYFTSKLSIICLF